MCACQRDKLAEPAAPAPASSVTASRLVPPPGSSALALPMPFEGEIVLAVKREAEQKVPSSLTFDVKNGKVRYVSDGSSVRTIADVTTHRAYEISDARRAFADLDTTRAAAAGTAGAATTVSKSDFTQKFAGVPCDVWTIDDAAGKVEVCVAKGFPFFELASTTKAPTEEPIWAAALTRENAFPLRVIAYDKRGNEEYRAEATRVDPKKLDDSLFQVPPGFKGDSAPDMRTASLP